MYQHETNAMILHQQMRTAEFFLQQIEHLNHNSFYQILLCFMLVGTPCISFYVMHLKQFPRVINIIFIPALPLQVLHSQLVVTFFYRFCKSTAHILSIVLLSRDFESIFTHENTYETSISCKKRLVRWILSAAKKSHPELFSYFAWENPLQR